MDKLLDIGVFINLLDRVEAICNLFAAIFLASIGMLIHVKFLWNHVDILLAAVILVIIVKSIVIAIVVKAFGYSMRKAFVVGLSLARIGEFSFVLLSRASHLPVKSAHQSYNLLGWDCGHCWRVFLLLANALALLNEDRSLLQGDGACLKYQEWANEVVRGPGCGAYLCYAISADALNCS